MKARIIVLVIMAACCLHGSASSRSQRARGEFIFNSSGCAHCHSILGVGGKKGPDLFGVGRRLKKDRMRKQILEGSNRMPPFGDVLLEKEIEDLVAYLRSCRHK
jgi:mono/diheme cytochrome c family protein